MTERQVDSAAGPAVTHPAVPRVLRRPLALGLDIEVVTVIFGGVPAVSELRPLAATVADTLGGVRPGVDCWRQWANAHMAGDGADVSPLTTFLTVVDRAGWEHRLQSGDHAFECWAFRAQASDGADAGALMRNPRPEDIVTSPEEGVLTFQQILSELIVNHGTMPEGTPAAGRLRFVVEMLATQTMRNALVMVGENTAYTFPDSTLYRNFARAYPHWPLLRGRPDQSVAERWGDVMDAFERIAREVTAA